MAIGMSLLAAIWWGLKNLRRLSWDDYNPVHVATGRLESLPVAGAFAFSPTRILQFTDYTLTHARSPAGALISICSNSAGGR
jgi:hypothetical protein